MLHSFGSDNHSGIHPEILEAIVQANTGHVVAYGDDIYTATAKDSVCDMLGFEADVYFMFNGTGANVLALRSITRPYDAIICTDTAHIWANECGAPECHTGCKLIAVNTPDGKLTPELVSPYLVNFGSQHSNQPKVISITQPTELGTLYTVEEIATLADLAHQHEMYLHVDGTRLANAVAALDVQPSRMLLDTGVDLFSFGGTKNGMMMGESVVYLNLDLSRNAKYERKQLMQLSSKMRFVSAQFEAYLHDGLWLKLARHANGMGALLAEKLEDIPEVCLLQKVETNAVFVSVPQKAVKKLREAGYYFNINDGEPCTVRWMCSFDTTEEDIDQLISALRNSL